MSFLPQASLVFFPASFLQTSSTFSCTTWLECPVACFHVFLGISAATIPEETVPTLSALSGEGQREAVSVQTWIVDVRLRLFFHLLLLITGDDFPTSAEYVISSAEGVYALIVDFKGLLCAAPGNKHFAWILHLMVQQAEKKAVIMILFTF